jgi:hypothetical protein
VYPPSSVSALVSVFVMRTSTSPMPCAGVVQVRRSLETMTTAVASVPSKVTVAPALNPRPVMTTAVPPAGIPVLGSIARTSTIGSSYS